MLTLPLSHHTLSDEPAESVPTVSLQPGDPAWQMGEYEGQLSVDVYQTDNAIVIKSTIAGVKPEDLDITLNNDVVTIRGRRASGTAVSADDYFYQECYWGGFSRSIVLPMEVHAERVEASLKNGVLTVTLPKAPRPKPVAVKVEPDDAA